MSLVKFMYSFSYLHCPVTFISCAQLVRVAQFPDLLKDHFYFTYGYYSIPSSFPDFYFINFQFFQMY
jgi:hypothetical protein